jgi:hypothetical protein
MAKSFSAQIDAWVLKVEGAIEAVFKEAVQELVDQADQLVTQMVYEAPQSPNYQRTGFLRSSLTVSTASMPLANRPQGAPDGGYMAEIEVQIAGAEVGETIYVGWTANYAGYVHYGARGAPPKPWVDLVAQRWDGIVAAKVAELKALLLPSEQQRKRKAGQHLPGRFQRRIASHGLGSLVAYQGAGGGQAVMDFVIA